MKVSKRQTKELLKLDNLEVNRVLNFGLEVGKWYFSNMCKTSIFKVTRIDSGMIWAFGRDSNGKYFENTELLHTHKIKHDAKFVEIPLDYVRNILCNDLDTLGYKVGTVVENINYFNFNTLENHSITFNGNVLSVGNVPIFKKGEWARIVKNNHSEKLDRLDAIYTELNELLEEIYGTTTL